MADRAVPGHWEGDLLMGTRDSAIATLVERQTRYCQLVALPEGTNAEPVCEALKTSTKTLPVQLRRSLTWDQGKEMTEHRRFSVETGVEVVIAQAALALRPALVASPTQPGLELLFDRPLDDQPGAEPGELGEHLLRVIDHPLDSNLSMLACISADGGTVRLTALASFIVLPDLREPTPLL